jgi:hypothetical protein
MRAWRSRTTIFLALTDQTRPWQFLRSMLVKLIDSKLIIFLLFAADFALQGVRDALVIRRIVNHSLGSEAAYDLRVWPRVRSMVFDAEVQSARYRTQRKDMILPCQIWARACRSPQNLGCLSIKWLEERVSICWEKLWKAVSREDFTKDFRIPRGDSLCYPFDRTVHSIPNRICLIYEWHIELVINSLAERSHCQMTIAKIFSQSWACTQQMSLVCRDSRKEIVVWLTDSHSFFWELLE